MARASGRTVELAVQRALAELDFAPGELAEDQYEVTIVIPPEEGFMGVGAVDAVVEVALVGEEFDFYGPEDDSHAGGAAEATTSRTTDDEDDDYDDGSGDRRLRRGTTTTTGGRRPEAARLAGFLCRGSWTSWVWPREIRITEGAEELHAEITGEDMGIFIGRRGQTIDAVEYLASIAVFPRRPSAQARRNWTPKGYKERRRRQIERVALRKADEAAKRGRPVQLDPHDARRAQDRPPYSAGAGRTS